MTKLAVFLKNQKVLLLLIILLASLLRLTNLDKNPPSLYGDELTMVYDAYSLSKNGFDQKGEKLPLVFKLGGSRPPGYVYATVPFAKLFGPEIWVARIVSALSGIGFVILLFLICRILFNYQVGLIAAFFGAIVPWGVSLSRAGFESNLALFLATLGVFAFLKGLKKPVWFFISALSFGISIQTYPTYRLTVPLFIILLGFVFRNELKKRLSSKKIIQIYVPVIILVFSIFLSFYLTFLHASEDRFSSINIFYGANSEVSNLGNTVLERTLVQLPYKLGYIFHNKGVEIATFLTDSYLENLSVDFLFLSGDSSPRHNPGSMGELYFGMLVLFLLGIYSLIKLNKKLLFFLLGWILISPVAASLVGGAHALRSSFMLAPLVILCALGVSWLLNGKLKLPFSAKKMLVVIMLFIALQFIFFVERVFFLSPKEYANFWSYSAKKAAQIAYENKDFYQFVVLSNDIADMEYAYPAYNRISPQKVIEQNKKRYEMGGYKFFRYDNVYIGSLQREKIEQFLAKLPGKVLYIGPFEESRYLSTVEVIKGLDEAAMLVLVKKDNKILDSE